MNGTTPQQRAKSLTTILTKTYDPYGEHCNVIDMLTDLRHLCDAEGWSFADLDRQAYQPEEGSYLTANEFRLYNVTTREKDSVGVRVCRNY